MKTIIKIVMAMLPIVLAGQSYTDYLGAGHDVGVTVISSHSAADSPADNTISGSGMESRRFAAARFLNQATFGPTPAQVDELLENDNDYEAWIDEQMDLPPSYILPVMESIWDDIVEHHVSQGGNPDELFGPWRIHNTYAWYQTLMTNEDQLRHRVAYALSQILVVSDNSDLNDWGEALSGYYDLLLEHAFGNYGDLLEEVTYSTQMGYYLSHFNNSKTIEEANISPDENYAREIMQLFTIGLYELNNDGSRVLDGDGNPIPTYDQDDIQNFANVFTGLGTGELLYPNEWPYQPFFGLAIWAAVKNTSMVMYQDFHETQEKTLLNGQVLPANQTGEQDISDAIDNLMNHDNVGPFISKLLIKRLVKSNPSLEYVDRIATIFNDNGEGEKGDLGAVVKAILLDPEARDGAEMLVESSGKAREPILKLVNLAKSLPIVPNSGLFWFVDWDYETTTGQAFMSSPTVFNYYPPNFQPLGDFSELELSAPELKLHNTSTAVRYANYMYASTHWNETPGLLRLFGSWENWDQFTPAQFDITTLIPLANNTELLINEIDRRLTYGQLSDQTRDNIIPVLEQWETPWNSDWEIEKIIAAHYFIMISPDFNIIK